LTDKNFKKIIYLPFPVATDH